MGQVDARRNDLHIVTMIYMLKKEGEEKVRRFRSLLQELKPGNVIFFIQDGRPDGTRFRSSSIVSDLSKDAQ